MKYLALLFLYFLLTSCTSATTNPGESEKDTREKFNIAENTSLKTDTIRAQQPANKIKYQYVQDPKSGLIQYRSPLPSSWILHQEVNAPFFITGPDGIKVSNIPTETYFYSNDPFMLQTMQMSGKEIAPVYSLDQIIEQHIKPSAQAQGYLYLNKYPLPEVVSFWQKFSAGMLQTGSQLQIHVVGTEWKDDKGNHSLIINVQMVITKGQAITWILQTTELEAPASNFEEAKKAYLYGVGNTEINPQWQQYKNGELRGQIQRNDAFWAAKSQESAQAHQQRMAAIQARGNASRSIGQTYSEISDISHAGYLKRSDINSAGHSKSINMIGGHTVIGYPETGERYNVEAGSKYYWVNKNGEYFGTDNSLYDPRIDNRINGSEWMKFEIEQ